MQDDKNRWFIRYVWFFVGVTINAIGVALITKAELGTSPISSVALVLSLKFAPSLGQFSFATNMLFMIVQRILLKKAFRPLQWLQIGVNLLFSTVLDITMHCLSWLNPAHLVTQSTVLMLGCAVLGVGISIEVAPDVLIVPGEGIVKAIALVSKRPFEKIKIIFDVSSVCLAMVLSYLFFSRLNGLGVGTIFSAFSIGKFVGLFNKRLGLIRKISILHESFSGT